jgi:hypothetical protein
MTLAERFVAANGGPITVDGQELLWTYWRTVKQQDVIHLTFLSAITQPLQGVGITAEKSVLEIASVKSRNFALWADNSPEHVEIRVVQARPGARVGFFNQWRDEAYGTTMYRLNDAAMRIEERDDGAVVLECSDGRGGLNFHDLTVQLRF